MCNLLPLAMPRSSITDCYADCLCCVCAGPREVVPRVSLPEVLPSAVPGVPGGDSQPLSLHLPPPPIPVRHRGSPAGQRLHRQGQKTLDI